MLLMKGENYDYKKLQRLRRKQGFTQKTFALEVGIHPVSVSRIERGLYVSYELLQHIATSLNVSVKEFLPD